MAAVSSRYPVLQLSPCSAYDRATLAAAIKPGYLPPGDNEAMEKRYMREKLSWRDPRGLKCYSAEAAYTDLYVYFDAGNQTSPPNAVATKAFSCYGLDGEQSGTTFRAIRGDCIIVKQAPPMSFGGPTVRLSKPYDPTMSVNELVDTLMFFEHENARSVAQQRDMARMFGRHPEGLKPHGYVGTGTGSLDSSGKVVGSLAKGAAEDIPTSVTRPPPAAAASSRPATSSGSALEPNMGTCKNCRKIGKMQRCSVCKVAPYCSPACQRADWKAHKPLCKPPSAAPAPVPVAAPAPKDSTSADVD